MDTNRTCLRTCLGCYFFYLKILAFSPLLIHHLWRCELLPWACSYPQLDTLQLLQRQLFFHTRGDSIYLATVFLEMTAKLWEMWQFKSKQVARDSRDGVSGTPQTPYLWIFHWALSLFCTDLYPLFVVNSSFFEKLKTTVLCCSFSILWRDSLTRVDYYLHPHT